IGVDDHEGGGSWVGEGYSTTGVRTGVRGDVIDAAPGAAAVNVRNVAVAAAVDIRPGLHRRGGRQWNGNLHDGGERLAHVFQEDAAQPLGERLAQRLEDLVVAVPAADIAESLAGRVIAHGEDAVGEFAVKLADVRIEVAADRRRVGQDSLVVFDEAGSHVVP